MLRPAGANLCKDISAYVPQMSQVSAIHRPRYQPPISRFTVGLQQAWPEDVVVRVVTRNSCVGVRVATLLTL